MKALSAVKFALMLPEILLVPRRDKWPLYVMAGVGLTIAGLVVAALVDEILWQMELAEFNERMEAMEQALRDDAVKREMFKSA